MQNICTIIKRNKKLLHLDLSNTQLTEYMLWYIGKSLARAKSLISCHLSGNQGVTPTLMELLQTRIRCASKVPYRKIGLELGIDPKNYRVRTQVGRFPKYDQQVIQEKMHIRQLMRQEVHNGDSQFSQAKTHTRLIFERKLGHKYDIPGSG